MAVCAAVGYFGVKPSCAMSNAREGWPDDLTIALPPGQTVEAIGQFVIQREVSKGAAEDTVQALVTTFGITSEDAALVYDRVLGGIVRASTRNSANRPDPANDPFAYFSYELARRDPGIIAGIRPDYVQAPDCDSARHCDRTAKLLLAVLLLFSGFTLLLFALVFGLTGLLSNGSKVPFSARLPTVAVVMVLAGWLLRRVGLSLWRAVRADRSVDR